MTGPHDVLVVGGGVAGLTAAFELGRAGLRVLVLEASDRFGGTVQRAVVDGLAVDTGAESFAVSAGTVQMLIGDLGLSADVVRPRPTPAWVRYSTGTAPLPAGGWLGIPATPWAADVRRVIGWSGSLRAVADLWLPRAVGRGSGSLGGLVTARSGHRVLDRLVEPVVGGVYSTPPDDLPLERLPPPARAALAGQRTLAGVAGQIRGGSGAAGSQVAGIRGGMYRLVEELVAAIETQGGQLRTGVEVTALKRTAGGWQLSAATETWSVSAVVLAGPAAASTSLLGVEKPAVEPGEVLLSTLVVQAPALNRAPRGTGVLVGTGVTEVGAKALTHATAKWEWLAAAAGPDRHVVRLSYGRIGDRGLPAAEAFPQLALNDAGRLLGVRLHPRQLLGSALTRWPVTGAAAGRLPVTPDTVVVTGGWVAGTGLAAVIGHARGHAAELTARLGVRSSTAGQGLR